MYIPTCMYVRMLNVNYFCFNFRAAFISVAVKSKTLYLIRTISLEYMRRFLCVGDYIWQTFQPVHLLPSIINLISLFRRSRIRLYRDTAKLGKEAGERGGGGGRWGGGGVLTSTCGGRSQITSFGTLTEASFRHWATFLPDRYLTETFPKLDRPHTMTEKY